MTRGLVILCLGIYGTTGAHPMERLGWWPSSESGKRKPLLRRDDR